MVGTPITGYVISATPVGSGAPVVTSVGLVTSGPVAGLADATTYQVTVAAQNAVGVGVASAAVQATTLPASNGGVPSAPTAPVVTAGIRSLLVSWSPPSSDSGARVTGYVIRLAPAGGGSTITKTVGRVTSTNVTGLADGTTYGVSVAAQNANGVGPVSPSVAATTVGVPSAPAAPTVGAGVRSLLVSWSPPASDGGSRVTDYLVQVTPSAGGTTTTRKIGGATSTTVNGLANGTTYKVTVAAKNAAGVGPASAAAVATTLGVPGVVSQPVVVPGSGDALVTWVPPDQDGGSPITQYTVRGTTGRARFSRDDRRQGWNGDTPDRPGEREDLRRHDHRGDSRRHLGAVHADGSPACRRRRSRARSLRERGLRGWHAHRDLAANTQRWCREIRRRRSIPSKPRSWFRLPPTRLQFQGSQPGTNTVSEWHPRPGRASVPSAGRTERPVRHCRPRGTA